MSSEISKFEKLIGDVEAFRLMLEGAFREWEGTYAVILADTRQYLFHPGESERFRPFCKALRAVQGGEQSCWKCDWEASQRAAQAGHPITYPCHAGLMDAAIPILIDGELAATIFCGQVRLSDEGFDKGALDKVRRVESERGFKEDELVRLWNQVPLISGGELNNTIDRVWRLVSYISSLGHERLQLRRAQQRQQRRLEESEVLETIARDLAGLTGDWNVLWEKVGRALEQVNAVIGATCGIVLMSDSTMKNERDMVIKAVAGLPPELFVGTSCALPPDIFREVVEEAKAIATPFREYDTLCNRIRQHSQFSTAELDITVLARISLSNEHTGVLLFFLGKQEASFENLPIEEEKRTLLQLASLIATAYQNCSLYQARQRDAELRRAWLTRVTHQLLSPLHGLQGYAENLRARMKQWVRESPQHFAGWTKEEIERWQDSLESMVWSSDYASRLAMNLAWAYTDQQRQVTAETVQDVGGLLIACARDFLGIAEQRRLLGVKVDLDSLACLNGRVRVDKDLFRQAVANLLDNAIKYSSTVFHKFSDGYQTARGNPA